MNRRITNLWLLAFSLLLLAALAACSDSETAPTDTPEAESTPLTGVDQAPAEEPSVPAGSPVDPQAYPPPPSMELEEGYPVGPADTPEPPGSGEPLVVPDPGEDTGVVTGQLLTPGPGGVPYLTTLFLGTTIYALQEDNPPMVSFSETDSLEGLQDPETGLFVFDNVPPGEYGLIMWTPISSQVVRDPETNQDIILEVKAGETIDLGIIGIP